MSDVFISYAHEDQAFARALAQALEAEGLSVWWDHTIPPGKTWNDFIARGIEEAKACIVLWSHASVSSKWVLEEASLAGDAGKLLPVAVDGAAPPMGFRSMQAAQLQGWRGDRGNAQFQLLAREARSLAGGGARTAPIRTVSRSPTSSYPPTASARPLPWKLIGGVGAALAALVLVMAFLNEQQSRSRRAEEAANYVPPAAEVEAQPATTDEAAAAPSGDAAELERLRRERDQALEAARNQEQENQRLVRERSAPAPASTPASSGASTELSAFLGTWTLANADRDDSVSPCSRRVRIRTEGSSVIWDYIPSGGSALSTNLTGTTHRIDGNTLHFNNSDLYWARLTGGQITLNQSSNTCTYRRE